MLLMFTNKTKIIKLLYWANVECDINVQSEDVTIKSVYHANFFGIEIYTILSCKQHVNHLRCNCQDGWLR